MENESVEKFLEVYQDIKINQDDFTLEYHLRNAVNEASFARIRLLIDIFTMKRVEAVSFCSAAADSLKSVKSPFFLHIIALKDIKFLKFIFKHYGLTLLTDEIKSRALYSAVRNDSIEMANCLIKDFGIAPSDAHIVESTLRNNPEMLKLIFETGIKCDPRLTAFKIAIDNQNLEMLKILIDNITSEQEITPTTIHRAAYQCNRQIINYLFIEKLTQAQIESALKYVVENGDLLAVTCIVEVYPRILETLNTKDFVNACKIMDMGLVSYFLLESNIKWSLEALQEGLSAAANQGSLPVVNLLIRHGATVDLNVFQAALASKFPNNEVVVFLLQSGYIDWKQLSKYDFFRLNANELFIQYLSTERNLFDSLSDLCFEINDEILFAILLESSKRNSDESLLMEKLFTRAVQNRMLNFLRQLKYVETNKESLLKLLMCVAREYECYDVMDYLLSLSVVKRRRLHK